MTDEDAVKQLGIANDDQQSTGVSARHQLNFDDPQVVALSQAVARAWTHPLTGHLVMNAELVWCAVMELMNAGAYIPDRHRYDA